MSERNKLRKIIINESSILDLSKQEKISAEQRLLEARQEYEAALREALVFAHTLHFRIAIFGSARLCPESDEFKFIKELTRSIVDNRKIDIVTGGGPGIMKAANEGLMASRKNGNGNEKEAKNYGLTIELPSENKPSNNLHFETKHEHFGTRLQHFVELCHGAYLGEGGIGTLLELLYVLQLKQVKHIEASFPLVAHPKWKNVVDSWNNRLYHERVNEEKTPLISKKDLESIEFSNDIDEIIETFSRHYDDWYKNIHSKVQIVD